MTERKPLVIVPKIKEEIDQDENVSEEIDLGLIYRVCKSISLEYGECEALILFYSALNQAYI